MEDHEHMFPSSTIDSSTGAPTEGRQPRPSKGAIKWSVEGRESRPATGEKDW